MKMATGKTPNAAMPKDWIHCLGTYRSRRQPALHRASEWSRAVVLAKRKHPTIIARLAKLMAGHLAERLDTKQKYTLVPVPSHKPAELFLFRELSLSAPELLAEVICRELGNPNVCWAAALVEKNTKARRQRSCNSDRERSGNVADVYDVCTPDQVWGRGIVLVDDVVTSGATMTECGRVLMDAGARSVLGMAIARTQRTGLASFVTVLDDAPDGDAA